MGGYRGLCGMRGSKAGKLSCYGERVTEPLSHKRRADVSESNLPLFPVSGWEIGPVPRLGLLIVRFEFLSHSLQKLTEADPGRRYALQPEQARKLITALQDSLRQLDNTVPGAPPGPTQ